MSKIKEIKKIDTNIKEIKLEKKETLEEEVEDSESENLPSFIQFRRGLASSTLSQSEAPQEVRTLQRVREMEDDAEVNFRPSYTGAGNPYASNAYTPVGSAESGGNQERRAPAESTLQKQDRLIERNDLQQPDSNRSASRPESGSERGYAGQEEQKDKRRHMM